jgi:glutamine phosphoribosylpyrophosphate amidotransferase
MCGVIGIEILDVRSLDISHIRSLLLESRIRGKHATGVSFLREGKVHTIKEPVDSASFLQKHPVMDWLDENGNITAIAHCRYSTSDLRFNQPISNERLALVHNGVISQELPENWKGLYDIDCETANDSELLFHRPSLEAWETASISALLLSSSGIEYMRNGKRPLWSAEVERGRIFASTEDIIDRSSFRVLSKSRINYSGDDLQP